jgi:hypothetical protein
VILFQSSVGQRAEPYDNSFRVTNERSSEHSVMTP